MKSWSYRSLGVLAALLALAFSVKMAMAQDAVEIAPDLHTVKLDNDQTRVYELKAKAGDKVAMHSHPNHIVYALSDSKVRLTSPEGESKEIELKAGDTIWAQAESHAGEFLADTNVLVVELKKSE